MTPRLNYDAWNEAYTVENRNETYSSVLPYCRAKTSLSPSTTVSTPYFSRYLQTKTRSLKSADRRYEIVHCYDRIIDKTRYTNVFPRKGEKQYTMSVLSVLNMPWPQSKSNINDDSTQRCNSSICVYFCSVHKNPLLYMQSLRSVWRQVKNTQAIEWKPYSIPHPKPNHINEFTFKNFLNLVSPNRSCLTISRIKIR